MDPSELSVAELATLIEQLRAENEQLRETVEEQSTTITKLAAELIRFKNAHTPPRRKRRGETKSGGSADDDHGDDEQPASTDDDADQDEARTDGGTVGRNQGHEPTWHDFGNIDDVEDVMLGVCPDCGDELGAANEVFTRIIEEIPEPPPIETIQYNLHEYYCDGCESTVRATHEDCPAEGSFGVNVLAQAA